jgi:hypothetical protein
MKAGKADRRRIRRRPSLSWFGIAESELAAT